MKNLTVQSHMEELIRIQPVFSEKEVTRLRKFHDLVDVHVRALKALEIDSVLYSSIVVPALMKKLTENIKLVITRGNEKCEDWKVEQFLQALLNEVELREIHSSRNKHSSSEVKRKSDVTTTSALFMKKDTLNCAFCRGNHPHEDCRKVVDLEDREKIIQKFG